MGSIALLADLSRSTKRDGNADLVDAARHATSGDVIGMVLAGALGPVGTGLTIGVPIGSARNATRPAS